MTSRVSSILLSAASIFSIATPARAQSDESARPLLQQLSHESQSLFNSVRPGLVSVQLPAPKWVAQLGGDIDSALDKYNLDPTLREKLRSERMRASLGQVNTAIAPSTQPNNPDGTEANAHPQLMMVQRPDGGFEFISSSAAASGANYDSVVGAVVAPRSLGVVYDEAGHVVISVYIDPQSFDDLHSIIVSGFHGGGSTRASFVGSDRQTNLTVLKLDQPIGKPAHFAGVRPADGALVMMLAAGGESGKLAVWTRGQQDRGVVVTVDGNIAGFARLGQFLDAQNARPVIDQLVQYGRVKRATLGVMVTEAEAPDGRRAMHVEHVKPGSAAETAGLRENDYILSLAGNPVDDLPNFAAAISAREGDTPMAILREGKSFDVVVKMHVE